MGVPRLKAKNELNYRKGLTHKECSGCDYFIPNWEDTGEGRCRKIGLQPGRQYRVLPHYLCDDFDDTKTMAAIKRDFFRA